VFDPTPFKKWVLDRLLAEKVQRAEVAKQRRGTPVPKDMTLTSEEKGKLPSGVRYHAHLWGPLDILAVEHARIESAGLLTGGKLGPAVPVHYFVWARGEAPQRHLTKLGGAPYLPVDVAWPLGELGKRMRFVGQINFADSHAILGVKLPGDILLFFDDPDRGDATGLWVTMSDKPLIAAADVPKYELDPQDGWDPTIAPMTGYLYASVEYPFVNEEEMDPDEIEDLFDVLPHADASKIGGVPAWIQDDESRKGTYIGCLSSVRFHQPAWALVNVDFGLDGRSDYLKTFPGEGEPFMLGDCGTLYAALNPDGSTAIASQSC